MIDVNAERLKVAAAARSWLGVPFCHATRDRTFGIDCVNLIAAAFEGVVDVPPMPRYSQDWFLHSEANPLVDGIRQYADQIAHDQIGVGDIVTFRFGKALSHAGIIVGFENDGDSLLCVHSYIRRGVVIDDLFAGSALARRADMFFSPKRWR